MATRIKEGMIPYTGGTGIEITDNHVINVLLRELNNLIHVNNDNELYVDLQLPDGILPDDDFPVGVTTGKILQADGWLQSGIILNWKTTSGDYVRFIYANDGKLYYDPGTGTWIEIGAGGGGVQINVATASALGLIKLGTDTKQTEPAVVATAISGKTYPVQLNNNNQAVVNIPWENTTYTAGTNISINQNNEISATIPSALVYKGNVNGIADLPSSGQTVGDTYFVEGEDAMYSWDGTQWNYVGGTGIDVSDLFNKTTDDSDDIVQGTTNLFVTQTEKNYWNNKQDTITAGTGISVSNNVVSNTMPFDPQNPGGLGQYLKKTNDGYAWATIPQGSTYTAGDGISISNNNVISNTDRFNPTNSGTAGQVLTKTNGGYAWVTGAGGGSNVRCFEIDMLTVTSNDLRDIVTWVNTGTDYGAIIKDPTQDGIFIYYETGMEDGNVVYYFMGTRYYADTTTTANGQFSTLQNQGLKITYSNGTYTAAAYGLNSYANFLKVEDSGYTTPYMPTAGYQPTTKAYVDSRNWTGTLSEYNSLATIDPDVVYNITSLT